MSVRVRLALLLPFFALAGGCYSLHSDSLKVTVGNATFLPELSTKSGSLHLRLLETINGAVIYAPSNSCTKIDYSNTSKTSYFGIIESEDSKSLSTTISNHHSNDDQRKDGQLHKNNKASDANSEKVTADAPITKRCDGNTSLKVHIPYRDNKETSNAIHQHQSLSDPSVAQMHHPIQYKHKTQNITTDNTSRDCRYKYLERSNQIGFSAFSYLLCRDRSYKTTS